MAIFSINNIQKIVPTSISSNQRSVVYFTRDISPLWLIKIYQALGVNLKPNIAVKISTGEAGNPHYLQPSLIGPLIHYLDGTIVECSTAYPGSKRMKISDYLQTIKDHGFFEISSVDLMDDPDEIEIPVKNGYHLKENIIGADLKRYNSLLILSHSKMHKMAGFGSAMKNMAIGIASRRGKIQIHTAGKGTEWGDFEHTEQDHFIESMVDVCSSVIDFMGKDNITYISVANNISIDCDCDSKPHKPEVPDIGIFASRDIVAVDQAFIDALYKLPDSGGKERLLARLKERNGEHILDAAKEKGLGNRDYDLKII